MLYTIALLVSTFLIPGSGDDRRGHWVPLLIIAAASVSRPPYYLPLTTYHLLLATCHLPRTTYSVSRPPFEPYPHPSPYPTLNATLNPGPNPSPHPNPNQAPQVVTLKPSPNPNPNPSPNPNPNQAPQVVEFFAFVCTSYKRALPYNAGYVLHRSTEIFMVPLAR